MSRFRGALDNASFRSLTRTGARGESPHFGFQGTPHRTGASIN